MNDTHIKIELRQPFWGAYKEYGWEKDVEGFGIKASLVKTALLAQKKLMIVFKYGKYEIAPNKVFDIVREYKSEFTARNGTLLYVVPRTLCKKIPNQ